MGAEGGKCDGRGGWGVDGTGAGQHDRQDNVEVLGQLGDQTGNIQS